MTVTFDKSSPEWLAFVAECEEKQRQFDATRGPCPKFCDGNCEANHLGDNIIHDSIGATITTDPVGAGSLGVAVKVWRYQSLTEPTEDLIDLDVVNASQPIDFVTLTAKQTRELIAELQQSLDMIDRLEPGDA